jgi:hypothetical protein
MPRAPTFIKKKIKVMSNLNCHKAYTRIKLYIKVWKKYFRNADTDSFNKQFNNSSGYESPKDVPRAVPIHQIPERDQIIELIRTPIKGLTFDEQFTRQCTSIKVSTKLQDRQESQRRGKFTFTSKPRSVPEASKIKPEEVFPKIIPEKCDPLQCPFCLGNTALPYRDRTKKLSRVNKLWDHVENVHRDKLAAYETGKKIYTICEAKDVTFFPESVPYYKNYTQTVHVIKLRA